MSSGRLSLRARDKAAVSGPPRRSTLTTCPVACTPASVRLATTMSPRYVVQQIERANTPATVRAPGCSVQPVKAVPSYAICRRVLIT